MTTTDSRRASLEEIRRFLRAESHVLSGRPQLLFQQAAHQPPGSVLTTAAGAGIAARRSPAMWLRRLHRPEQTTDSLLRIAAGGPLALAPDARRLAACRVVDGEEECVDLRLWDLESGRDLGLLRRYEVRPRSCAFSPQGEQLACLDEGGTLSLWDLAHGREVESEFLPEQSIAAFAYLPDGRLLIGWASDASLTVLSLAVGPQLLSRGQHLPGILRCVVAPTGERFASLGRDGTLKLWNTVRGECCATLRAFRDGESVGGCEFSADGKLVAGCSLDEGIKVWEAASGQLINEPTIHSAAVEALAFTPGGELLSVSLDQSALLSNPRTGEVLATLADGLRWPLACAVARDGRSFVTLAVDGIQLWPMNRAAAARQHRGFVHACRFSCAGEQLVSSGADGRVRIWDGETGQPLQTLEASPVREVAGSWLRAASNRSMCNALSPRDAVLAAGYADWTVRLWDGQNGGELAVLTGHAAEIDRCEFAARGRRLVALGGEKLLLWDCDRPGAVPLRVEEDVFSFALNDPTGLGASGFADGRIQLWGLEDGADVRALRGATGLVGACAFSPDGELLLAAAVDHGRTYRDSRKLVTCWKRATGAIRHQGQGGEPLCFSPDGRLWVAQARDGELEIWDARTFERRRALAVGCDEIGACALSPDGRFLAVIGSGRPPLSIWEMDSGHEAASWWLEHPFLSLAWHPSSRRLAVGSTSGAVLLLQLEEPLRSSPFFAPHPR